MAGRNAVADAYNAYNANYAYYANNANYAIMHNYANYAINSTLTLVELSRLTPSPNRRSSPLPPCAAHCPELLGHLPRRPPLFHERVSGFWRCSCEGPLEGRAPLVARQ